jgi:hypothetical protein
LNRAGTTCFHRRVVASAIVSQLPDAPPSSAGTKAASSASSVRCGSSISDLKRCAPEGRIAAWVFSLYIFFGLRNHAGRRSEPISRLAVGNWIRVIKCGGSGFLDSRIS